MNNTLSLTLGAVRAGGGAPSVLFDDTIGYGQSNWLGHTQTTYPGQPSAHPDTFIWDNVAGEWVTPTGAGVIAYLNARQARTGKVCRFVSGGNNGVPIAWLQKGFGSGHYENLMGAVVASGINPSRILFQHGEGDTVVGGPNNGVFEYREELDILHGQIASDLGKAKSQIPMFIGSLSTTTFSSATDESWDLIKTAQVGVNSTYPNIHYSHSNQDADRIDSFHWNGQSYERSGKRYEHSVAFQEGAEANQPDWYALSATRHSNTETDVLISHSMGTDFTPTSGITGFVVSDDNGASWEAATGVRVAADRIRLTHSDMGSAERLVDYQRGKTPDISGAVKDNGTLASPLNFTAAPLVAEGAVAAPSITYAASATSGSGGTTQTATGISVPGSSEPLLAVIGVTNNSSSFPTSLNVTAQPSGVVVAATAVLPSQSGAGPAAYIYQAELPGGTTSVNLTLTYASNPFGNARFHVSTIPVASLTSTTAVSAASDRTVSVTTQSTNVATSDGGVIFAIGINSNVTSNSGVLSGDETFATRNSLSAAGATHVVGDASGVAADTTSLVTATFVNSANTRVSAVSYR